MYACVYACIYACMCVCMCMSIYRCPKSPEERVEQPGLKWQAVVSHLIWVRGIEIGPLTSVTATSALG